MKYFLIFIAVMFVNTARADVIFFAGNRVTGELSSSLSSAGDISFHVKPSYTVDPIDLPLIDIEKIIFHESSTVSKKIGADYEVQLLNGEVLPVASALSRGDKIDFQHVSYGKITVDRTNISAISRQISPPYLIENGDVKMESWEKINQRGFQVSKSNIPGEARISGEGSIVSPVRLPSRYQLSFEVSWSRHRIPEIEVFFSPEDKPLHGYALILSKDFFGLHQRTESSKVIAQLNRVTDSFKQRRMLVSLKIDHENGFMKLGLNDTPVGYFAIDQNEGALIWNAKFTFKKPHLHRLKNVRFEHWNIEREFSKNSEKTSGEDQQLIGINGEILAGEMLSLNAQTVKWKTPGNGELLELPWNQVERIQLKKYDSEIKNLKSPWKVSLLNGHRLYGKKVMIQRDKLVIVHAIFGEIQVLLNHLISVENLRKEKR